MDKNSEDRIKGGSFQIARRIFEGELWLTKPASWKVIWVYILGKVNHTDRNGIKRGEGYFNWSSEIRQVGRDITLDMIKSFCQFARATLMIDTMRTTRGMIIKVLNYNKYQTFYNYTATTETTREPRENHERTTMVHKNDKNEKNEKNKYIAPPSSAPFVWDDYLLKMMEDKQRQIRVIAKFFSFKGIRFESSAEAQVAIRRHLRAAVNVGHFSNDKIMQAMEECGEMEVDWTLETVEKVLTK